MTAIATFAQPPGYQAAKILIDEGRSVIVLSGPAGSGRHTAAVNLLAGLQIGVTECDLDWSKPQTKLLPLETNGRYLLDLSTERESVPSGFGGSLSDYAAKLSDRGGRLIILTTPELWKDCAEYTRECTVDLKPPEPSEVVEAHLRETPPHLDWLRSTDQLGNLVTECSTSARAVDLAQLIRSRSTLTDADAASVVQQFHHWQGELDGLLKARSGTDALTQATDARARCLLITAAVLDGAPDGVVLDAMNVLQKKLKVEPTDADVLLGPELTDLVEQIGADWTGDSISLSRRSPGIDEAVMTRVWHERPQMRQGICRWLAAITGEGGVAAGRLDRIALVLTRLATHTADRQILDLLQSWASGHGRRRSLAITVLERLAVAPEAGAPVRRALYYWARQKKTGPTVLTAIAEVCGGTLGEQKLQMALARLLILLQRDEPEVRAAAGKAVRQLAGTPGGLSAIRETMSKWNSTRDDTAAGLVLLALADPGADGSRGAEVESLLQDLSLRSELERGWAALIGGDSTRAAAQQVMNHWITVADSRALDRELTVEILLPLVEKLRGKALKKLVYNEDRSPTRCRLVMAYMRRPDRV
ncbi:hypothetical protein AB0P21_41000 [Kribbella sp. NPDC056861]|uniref:hypothetical protein n=1 Tax=Kribbella sp. NPDC056861 TaxID=3154857 RepID=UPI00341D0C05